MQRIIKGMDISRQDPRRNQKERTRAAIVDAARSLLREGVTPTVSTAAEAAKVSRPTAYRYFPTQDALLSEIMDITPSTEPVDEAVRRLDTADPRRRLGRLLDVFNRIVVDEESRYRAALRVYLDTWFAARKAGEAAPAVRAGRRRRWLDETLAPLRTTLPPKRLTRLKNALALTMGIDSLVILKDVCGLDNAEALAVLRWAALAILDAAVAEADGQSSADGQVQS
ncbi:MAG TPA: TetR/AcrR family transcriptional regulator [Chloroflexota bacterium]|nr:TetR/AcrR family transcriptional regulator [Chloroflexota bacterium]